MGSFKGKRGEALSMALIVLAMALTLNLHEPGITDWLSLSVLVLALGRIVWIFPSSTD